MTDEVIVRRDVQFNIFSGALKALPMEAGGDGVKRLSTTASSSIVDLSGDEMTLSALQKMAATAEKNMTIFLNHRYAVPEDVLGSVEKASIEQKNGEDYDLDFIIRVNESNPRAVQTWKSIHEDGVQLGCSIGALIPEGGAVKKAGGLQINDVKLLEASIVGIPANPRSFVQYATKALQKAQLEDLPADDLGFSGPPLPVFSEASTSGLPTVTSASGGTVTSNTTRQFATQQTNGTGGVWDAKAQVWVTIDTDDAPARAAGTATETATDEKAKGKSSKKKDTEPDIQKESAPPAEGDEGEPDTAAEDSAETTEASQEAPQSVPESDGVADEATVDEQIEAQKSLGIDTLAGVLKATTRQLVEVQKELRVEREKTAAAETRASGAEENLRAAKEIVERIAALPIGRKTSFAEGVSEFRKTYGGLYSDEVLDVLEKTHGS